MLPPLSSMDSVERRVAMKAKVLMTLLLSALAQPLLAMDTPGVFIGVTIQVAQLTPEERRALRERWEMAGPEERMEMRRRFQERLQQPGPRQRPPVDFGGFGTGFERRLPIPPMPPEADPDSDPRAGFPYPAGRHRR